MILRRFLLLLPLAALSSFLIRFSIWRFPTNGLDLLLGLAIVVGLTRFRWKNYSRLWFSLVLGLFVAGAVGVWVAPDKASALGAYKSFIVLPIIYVGLLLAEEPTIPWPHMSFALLTNLAIASVYGLIHYFTHSQLRLSSWFDSPNFFALMAVPILMLNLPFVFQPKWSKNWGWMSCWWLGLIAFLLTVSLGGYIAFAAGLVVFILSQHKKITWVKGILLGLTCLSMLIVLVPINRFATAGLSRKDSLTARGQIWDTAKLLIINKPITGIGLRQFESQYDAMVPRLVSLPLQYGVPEPHNLFLALWANLGLLGVACFYILFVRGVLILSQFSTAAPLLGALAAIVAHGMVDTPLFQNDLSVIVWLVLMFSFWVGQQGFYQKKAH